MASSLSNLIDNITEGIHKIKYKNWGCFLEYESIKENLTKHKCLSFSKDYSNKLDEELKKKFKKTFKFSIMISINLFVVKKRCLSLWIHGDWENFNETILPEKEEFYSNLNIEDITDVDYMQGQSVSKTLTWSI